MWFPLAAKRAKVEISIDGCHCNTILVYFRMCFTGSIKLDHNILYVKHTKKEKYWTDRHLTEVKQALFKSVVLYKSAT